MAPREVIRLLIEFPWIVFVIYWIAKAFNTRPPAKTNLLALALVS